MKLHIIKRIMPPVLRNKTYTESGERNSCHLAHFNIVRHLVGPVGEIPDIIKLNETN